LSNYLLVKMTKVIDTILNHVKNDVDKQSYLYTNLYNNKIPIKYKTSNILSLNFKNYLDNQKVCNTYKLFETSLYIYGFTLGIISIILIFI